MKRAGILLISAMGLLAACTSKPKPEQPAAFLTAKESVLLNRLVYMSSLTDSMAKLAPNFAVVYQPPSINGNFAFIAQKKNTRQYALVIRGSVLEFNNDGFQNFILQDFNIFNLKKWEYADTVQEAYIGRGTWLGFQNLLQLKDPVSGASIKTFLEQLPKGASLVITGHSLGGNLAYPVAGYLKKELSTPLKDHLQLITFGATAAGNAAFVKDLEEKFPEGERYVIDKDIAPSFPDHEQIDEIARTIGLDKVFQLPELSLDAGDLLSLAGDILEKTNVINSSNKYRQSQLHLRLLKSPLQVDTSRLLSAEIVFGRAYQFHRVDAYAALLSQ